MGITDYMMELCILLLSVMCAIVSRCCIGSLLAGAKMSTFGKVT